MTSLLVLLKAFSHMSILSVHLYLHSSTFQRDGHLQEEDQEAERTCLPRSRQVGIDLAIKFGGCYKSFASARVNTRLL